MEFDGLEPWYCEDVKLIVVTEIGVKSLGTFEKWAPDHNGERLFSLNCVK